MVSRAVDSFVLRFADKRNPSPLFLLSGTSRLEPDTPHPRSSDPLSHPGPPPSHPHGGHPPIADGTAPPGPPKLTSAALRERSLTSPAGPPIQPCGNRHYRAAETRPRRLALPELAFPGHRNSPTPPCGIRHSRAAGTGTCGPAGAGIPALALAGPASSPARAPSWSAETGPRTAVSEPALPESRPAPPCRSRHTRPRQRRHAGHRRSCALGRVGADTPIIGPHTPPAGRHIQPSRRLGRGGAGGAPGSLSRAGYDGAAPRGALRSLPRVDGCGAGPAESLGPRPTTRADDGGAPPGGASGALSRAPAMAARVPAEPRVLSRVGGCVADPRLSPGAPSPPGV
ncbi:hypothetical protein EDD91_3592 [Streptomyces sp. KS 21]|nr:hypothetical protein EDD91_3592 [Streptomyces sp. KS 21]